MSSQRHWARRLLDWALTPLGILLFVVGKTMEDNPRGFIKFMIFLAVVIFLSFHVRLHVTVFWQ